MLTTKDGVVSVAAATIAMWSACAWALTPQESLELLGKNVFFDTSLSTPGNKQGCVSCHEPTRGWVFPDSKVNLTTVVAPGAAPHRQGFLKPPANAYASLEPVFQKVVVGFCGLPLPCFGGGNFWNGRAEGCGANPGSQCPVPDAGDVGVRSESITPDALTGSPLGGNYLTFLGPTADQALNPFPKGVEQNAGEKKVCTQVKTAKYKQLYFDAYGEEIDCRKDAVHTSFQRIAVALAAWQKSKDVVRWDSPRDKALKTDPHFPLESFTRQQNRGHDLFYGVTSPLNPSGKNAGCAGCHHGLPNTMAVADPLGEDPNQIYTDHRYHNIGIPFNRQIPDVVKGEKRGLAEHVSNKSKVEDGFFKTPTLRNVAMGLEGGFTKAFGHNGYFKSLEAIVHFYNTRDKKPACAIPGNPNPTAAEALANKCWPAPEFDKFVATGTGPFVFIGNLGLTTIAADGDGEDGENSEEAAIVAYLKTLADDTVPERP